MFKWLLFIPFIIQTLAMFFDEFYFHWKRGLPKWERLGHPLDTLSVLAVFGYVSYATLQKETLIVFILLAVVSCLLITKDEWVHKEHCEGKEQWLHALLFINHPLTLICLAYMWKEKTLYFPFIIFQLSMTALFFSYQTLYWNLLWKPKKK